MNQRILEEIKRLNKTVGDFLLFQLCQAGYSNEQIRDIVGSADNNKVAKIRAGLKVKTK